MLNNQLSSSQINETLLNAMKTIAQKEVSNLAFDVTEKYTILEKTKNSNGEECYIINANGIEYEVYAIGKEEYSKGDIVLINIPKNNITDKKYIIGLADNSIKKYYLPNSNFIPMLTVEEEKFDISTDIITINKNSHFDEFYYSNSIYIKCDFKNINSNIDYIYGLKLKIEYLSGEKKDYYFTSDLFTGNPNVPYYFSQDAIFDNIPNFKNIKNIGIDFVAFKDIELIHDISLNILNKEVFMKNLQVSIGEVVTSEKSGIKIVSKSHKLDYNEHENDFSRELGLVWYNRDENGNFIGFNTGLEFSNNFNNIISDEYDYYKEKQIYNQRYLLHKTELYPFDIIGLDLVYDINEAEGELQELNNCFLNANKILKEFITEYKAVFQKINDLIQPEKFTNNTSDYNLLEAEYALFFENYSNVLQHYDEISLIQSNCNSKTNELNNIWINFIGQMFSNVRKMQSLEKNLSGLELKKPLSAAGKEINFLNIFEYLMESIEVCKKYYNDEKKFIKLYIKFIDGIKNYLNGCEQKNNQLSESRFSNLREKINKYIIQLEKYLDDYILQLKESYSLSENEKYKNFSIRYFDIWDNKKFIDTENYLNDNLYYNIYYIKYKIEMENFNNNIEMSTIISKRQQFVPEFKYSKDKEKQDTIAIYWYEEDLYNTSVDPLLNEAYWTLIPNDDFDTYPETVLNKLSSSSDKKYTFKKATPYKKMLKVTLPENLQTKTYQVILFYNHKEQERAKITFNNKQYTDIGFDNSNIDLEYVKDIQSLIITSNEYLPIKIVCYDIQDGRKILSNVKINRENIQETQFPSLQISLFAPFCQEKGVKEIFEENKLNIYRKNSDDIIFLFQNNKNKNFIPYGVYTFKLFIDEKTYSTAYLPLSWSTHQNIVLHGAKMVSFDKDDKIIFDSWINDNSNPTPYKIIGNENLSNIEYSIEYYDQGGTLVSTVKDTAAESAWEAFYLNYNNNTNEYFLGFDSSKAKLCLKSYRPILKIVGLIDNKDKFTIYQSLFIQHSDYDYVNANFFNETVENTLQTVINEAVTYNFLDEREKIMIFDLIEQIDSKPSNYSKWAFQIKQDERLEVLEELKRIFYDEKISKGYEYFLEKMIHQSPSFEEWKTLLNIINKSVSSDDWIHKFYSCKVYNVGKGRYENVQQNFQSWVQQLFKDFINIYNQYIDKLINDKEIFETGKKFNSIQEFVDFLYIEFEKKESENQV